MIKKDGFEMSVKNVRNGQRGAEKINNEKRWWGSKNVCTFLFPNEAII